MRIIIGRGTNRKSFTLPRKGTEGFEQASEDLKNYVTRPQLFAKQHISVA
jgi:hypothetical protein